MAIRLYHCTDTTKQHDARGGRGLQLYGVKFFVDDLRVDAVVVLQMMQKFAVTQPRKVRRVIPLHTGTAVLRHHLINNVITIIIVIVVVITVLVLRERIYLPS